MLPSWVAILVPICATLLGGWVVLRSSRSLRPWLSLSGGVLLGLAFLDLLPEAFEHGAEVGWSGTVVGGIVLGSILFFHILDKVFDFHGHEGHDHACNNGHHKHGHAHLWTRLGGMGFHGFLDGLAVGGGFAADLRLGILVTAALALHKLTDGMTTVTLMRKHEKDGERKKSVLALIGIICTPLLGVAASFVLEPSTAFFTFFLAGLGGLFIHLPLSELLPEAHEGGASRQSLLLTVLGIALILLVQQFVHV